MTEPVDRRDLTPQDFDEREPHQGTDEDLDGLLERDSDEDLRLGDAGRPIDDTTDAVSEPDA